jgi:hypothetical protein
VHSSPVRAFVCAVCLSCLPQLVGAEPVVVARDSNLYSEPRADSSVVTRLREGTRGDTSAVKGAWTSVKTAAGSGWVLSFDLRFGSGAAAGSAAGGGGLVSRLTGSERTNVTATIGIRGFDAETLRKAQFDAKQVQQLESYAIAKQQARSTAASAGLTAQKVDYLR